MSILGIFAIAVMAILLLISASRGNCGVDAEETAIHKACDLARQKRAKKNKKKRTR